jgi:O-antigen/teichoic acid export membrane protein
VRQSTFLRRSFEAIVGQAGQAVGILAVTVAVSRVARPEARGEFVLLTTIPQLGTYVVALGLPAAILASVASDPSSRQRMATLAAGSAVATGVVLTAASYPLLAIANATIPPAYLLLAGNTSVAWLILVSWLYFGEQRFLRAGVIRTVPLVLATPAVVLVASHDEASVVGLYAAWVVPAVLVSLVTAALLHRQGGYQACTATEVKERVSYGLKFSIGQIAQLGALRLDQWFVAVMASTQALGIYSIAAASSEGVLVAATAIGVVVFSDTAKGSTDATFRRQLIGSLIAVIGLAGILALIAPVLVPALFGTLYASAVTPLLILLIGTPGLVALRLATNRLAGMGSPGLASSCSIVTLVGTVCLDVVLIPRSGMNGAAVASSIGYSLGGAVGLASLRRRSRSTTTRRLAHVA